MPIDNNRFTLCHEKWAEMTPSERGRLCAKCNKQVVDFRSLPTADIERTLAETPGTCGLYTPTQFRNPAPLIAATAAALALTAPLALTPSVVDAQTTGVTQLQDLRVDTIRVFGTVTDSATGRPLAGAQIMAFNRGTISNAEGRFEFRIPKTFQPPYRIIAQLIGYHAKTFDFEKPDNAIDLQISLAQQTYVVTGLVVTGGTQRPKRPEARVSAISRIVKSIRRIF